MSYADDVQAIKNHGHSMAAVMQIAATRVAMNADAEIASLRAALDRLLCATEGHDVCPYAKAEARYVLTPEGK